MSIPVSILGATGVVGQQFVHLLNGHPSFHVVSLHASARSAGRRYDGAANWKLSTAIPAYAEALVVDACSVDAVRASGGRVVFSALDADVAADLESALADAGFAVFSNAKSHRMDADVPILIPTANPQHIHIVRHQQKRRGNGGYIICNANCSSTGLAVALRPLMDAYGVAQCHVVTLQAVSGAGYPGVPSLDIMDNVIPYISGEEPKMESEPRKILGGINGAADAFEYSDIRISAQCNRVHVIDGHTECVSVKLKRSPANIDELLDCLRAYSSAAQTLKLASAPPMPLHVFTSDDRPQPRLDRHKGNGMTVCIGRVRECPLFDYKFVITSHNTVIGAAGGSILNAELALAEGYINPT